PGRSQALRANRFETKFQAVKQTALPGCLHGMAAEARRKNDPLRQALGVVQITMECPDYPGEIMVLCEYLERAGAKIHNCELAWFQRVPAIPAMGFAVYQWLPPGPRLPGVSTFTPILADCFGGYAAARSRHRRTNGGLAESAAWPAAVPSMAIIYGYPGNNSRASQMPPALMCFRPTRQTPEQFSHRANRWLLRIRPARHYFYTDANESAGLDGRSSVQRITDQAGRLQQTEKSDGASFTCSLTEAEAAAASINDGQIE
uniref:Ig-like domain-containing protein n=1 Tax=Macrostomum lignano TaxID=282301 RepID=A0A1I8FNG0_9PLAT